MRKLALLGGGSAYAPGLLQALVDRGAELALTEVRLYDLAPGRLEVVARLGAKLARAAGAPFDVHAVETLEAAVDGVDAVLNSTRPGGFAGRRLDETLPLEFDIPGQETVGPGGLLYALRSVPEALRVARAMQRQAPSAVLLNYTNPTNIVTQALVDAGFADVLGLCDQSDEDLQALGVALGRPGVPWTFACAGLNHATWYSDVAFGGEPFRGLPADAPAEPPPWFDEEHRLRFAVARRMAARCPGWWPNSYLAYYEAPAELVACARRGGPRTDAIVARLDEYYAHFAQEAARERPRLRLYRGSTGFGDLAVRVLTALGSPSPCPVVLNVPNRGAMPAFAEDTVVELPVLLGAAGRVPRAGGLPPAFKLLAGRLEAYQRAAARAAASGEPDEVLEAMAANPLVPSRETAAALLARARAVVGTVSAEVE
ncbi:MAG: hypothetical protein JXB32_04525 [Deltaproteobacteria bacterium]|nr:hypothetical protein [Deltaproteobacteria bacterium]